ncbi:hypothetical protein ACVRXX_07015 [Streptococcus plurextorum]
MAKEIMMNVDEMQEIMRLMTSLEVSFHTVLAPKLQTLSTTNYYEGGEASKTLKHYTEMLNKVNEIGDLYSRANSEVYQLVEQWLEQDKMLAQSFYDSLDPNGQLVQNITILSGGGTV